jgi:hypothetical protein
MTRLPYPIIDLIKDTKYQTATSPAVTWKVWLDLADSADQGIQRERLSILTHVLEPTDGHSQGLELAAIQRVHALLGEQIEAMQSR